MSEAVLTAYCDKCLTPYWKDHDTSFLCPKCIVEEEQIMDIIILTAFIMLGYIIGKLIKMLLEE